MSLCGRSGSRVRRTGAVAFSAVALAALGLAAAPALAAQPAGAASSAKPAAAAAAKPGGPPAKTDAAKVADKRAAQKLLAQGNQLVGEGDYLGALEKFRGAYAKYASPKILLNLGTTLRQLGRNVEAAEVYEQYLRDPERDAAREKDVTRVLAEIDAVVGRVLVEVDDPSATVRLDGKQLDGFVRGESRRVEPGEHTLMAEKPGASPAVQSIMVKARQEHLVTLRFAPPPPKVEPPPASSGQRTLGLAIGGVGVVALAAGAIVGIAAAVQNGAANSHCYQGGTACDADGVEAGQSAKTSATISTIGLVAGAGLLASGALIWLTGPTPPKERSPGSSPAAAPAARWIAVAPTVGGAAVTVGGAF